MTVTNITTNQIKDATILNADVDPAAAIAGTKISPNFGAQNITTTGVAGIGLAPGSILDGPYGFEVKDGIALRCDSTTSSVAVFRAFSYSAGAAGLSTYYSNGTIAAPSQALTNDTLMFVGAKGYGATAFSTGSKAAMEFRAAEDWTDSAQGTFIRFRTTASGSTTIATRLTIQNDGNLLIGSGTTGSDSRATGSMTLGASMFLGALAGDPSTPVAGQVWYNTTDQQFKGRNATSIVILG